MEQFLKELNELCQKHSVQLSVDIGGTVWVDKVKNPEEIRADVYTNNMAFTNV